MYAYNSIIAAIGNIQPQRPRAPIALQPERTRAAALLVLVANSKQVWQVPVDKGVSVAYNLSVKTGQKTQRVLNLTFRPGFSCGLGNCVSGGSVSPAGAAC